jgi:hypothetical protein
VDTHESPFHDVLKHGTETECDVDGNALLPVETRDGKHFPPRRILQARHLRLEFEDCDGRSRLGKYLKHLIPMAERYEADCETARDRSGLRVATEAQYLAASEVVEAATAIRKIEARSYPGLAIKARAIIASDRAAKEMDGGYHRPSVLAASGLAENLLRLGTA